VATGEKVTKEMGSVCYDDTITLSQCEADGKAGPVQGESRDNSMMEAGVPQAFLSSGNLFRPEKVQHGRFKRGEDCLFLTALSQKGNIHIPHQSKQTSLLPFSPALLSWSSLNSQRPICGPCSGGI
jgi:hypothetical protein